MHYGFIESAAGRRAPEYLRYDQDLLNIVRHFFETNKPVAVLYHGAEIVGAAGVIRGKRMATVPKCKLDIELCGAEFVDEGCVRDGNMVSGRTWHDNHLYMKEFMAMLKESSQREGKSVRIYSGVISFCPLRWFLSRQCVARLRIPL